MNRPQTDAKRRRTVSPREAYNDLIGENHHERSRKTGDSQLDLPSVKRSRVKQSVIGVKKICVQSLNCVDDMWRDLRRVEVERDRDDTLSLIEKDQAKSRNGDACDSLREANICSDPSPSRIEAGVTGEDCVRANLHEYLDKRALHRSIERLKKLSKADALNTITRNSTTADDETAHESKRDSTIANDVEMHSMAEFRQTREMQLHQVGKRAEPYRMQLVVGVVQDLPYSEANLEKNDDALATQMEVDSHLADEGCIISTIKPAGETTEEQHESARELIRSLLGDEPLLPNVVAITYGDTVIRVGESDEARKHTSGEGLVQLRRTVAERAAQLYESIMDVVSWTSPQTGMASGMRESDVLRAQMAVMRQYYMRLSHLLRLHESSPRTIVLESPQGDRTPGADDDAMSIYESLETAETHGEDEGQESEWRVEDLDTVNAAHQMLEFHQQPPKAASYEVIKPRVAHEVAVTKGQETVQKPAQSSADVDKFHDASTLSVQDRREDSEGRSPHVVVVEEEKDNVEMVKVGVAAVAVSEQVVNLPHAATSVACTEACDVFISNVCGEAHTEALVLQEALQAQGMRTFVAGVAADAGARDHIAGALENCCFVVILATDTCARETNRLFDMNPELSLIVLESKPYCLVKMSECWHGASTQQSLDTGAIFNQWQPGSPLPSELVEQIRARVRSSAGNRLQDERMKAEPEQQFKMAGVVEESMESQELEGKDEPAPSAAPQWVKDIMDPYVKDKQKFRQEVIGYLCERLPQRGKGQPSFNDKQLLTAYAIKKFFDEPGGREQNTDGPNGIGTRALMNLLRNEYDILGKSQFFELKKKLGLKTVDSTHAWRKRKSPSPAEPPLGVRSEGAASTYSGMADEETYTMHHKTEVTMPSADFAHS